MSVLSDQVEAALRTTVEKANSGPGDDAEFINIAEDEVGKTPGLFAMREYYVERAGVLIHKVYRRHVGSAPFKDPVDAYESTKDEMYQQIVPMLITSFADGVQMGQERSQAYQKYNLFRKLDSVFGNDSWRMESDLIAMPMLIDMEIRTLFTEYVNGSVTHIGGASGYAVQVDPRSVSKIWDLWAVTAYSTVVGAYAGGYKLGKQWQMQDTLAGILAASESSDG